MSQLPGKAISYWIASTPHTSNFLSLTNDISVDVAIVGGGIAGITAAILLKRAGKTVAVLDAQQIATGVSGHTTAKVTSLHQLIYAQLIKEVGEEKAQIYANSNQAAIERVAKFVEEENIDCDFSRRSAYTFAETTETLDDVRSEVEAALQLGLPASFVTETSLPFAIAGAVKFDNQAQFHARKYLLHLARLIEGNGSYVFENTRVRNVEEGNPCQVVTATATVTAKNVIIATNAPILDQGLFFAKNYPKRSYIIAARIDPAQAPEGMYIGTGNDYYSIRTTPAPDGGLLLLVGGGGHKAGTVTNTEERYLKLENYARSRFGVEQFEYRWSTQDMVSFDQLPYIGKVTPLSNHLYVATGFSLWGMSKGTLAGMLLSDLILGIDNPWLKIYNSTRATPFVTVESLKNNLEVGFHWVGDRLKGLERSSLADVAPGEGKLLTINGHKIAAYRDEEGQIHAVSATCTHLGCIVNWNSAEKSWDCPCHGGRYNCDGKVLHGPPVKNLKRYKA
ncbi:MAG: FAD-dependent oxidoreductase [Chlorogloeopsis fritschii C42_A2020_084]|uniref:FAD-dependent oxidoreductase n=1 Tax=Chlorogloeopsis fritschii TaxID=1124 RepID=UPI0019E50EF0|nr:FAD-dependent oxidoreductase [Chlorogloeopsis fritschii]MBF2009567.1 FAD-dependent oxidoreductase [Chlorogloeopsis fritschii C42_A2020_084]